MPLAVLPDDGSLEQSEPSHPMLLPHGSTLRHSTNHRVKYEPPPARVRQLSRGFQESHHAVSPSPSDVPCSLLSSHVAFALLFQWVPLPGMLSFRMCEADSFPHKTLSSQPPARACLVVQSLSSFYFWASLLSRVLPRSYADSLEKHNCGLVFPLTWLESGPVKAGSSLC